MLNYTIYDSRATYDIDEAQVVEAFQTNSNKAAIRYYRKNYQGYSYVLCDQNNNILASFN